MVDRCLSPKFGVSPLDGSEKTMSLDGRRRMPASVALLCSTTKQS